MRADWSSLKVKIVQMKARRGENAAAVDNERDSLFM